jgi:hypothetical protein
VTPATFSPKLQFKLAGWNFEISHRFFTIRTRRISRKFGDLKNPCEVNAQTTKCACKRSQVLTYTGVIIDHGPWVLAIELVPFPVGNGLLIPPPTPFKLLETLPPAKLL